MPELPEVHTTVLGLRKKIKNLIVKDIWTDHKKLIKKPADFNLFKKDIRGRKIENIERRGKNIIIFLSGNKVLWIHQKMTGHLLVGAWEIKSTPVFLGKGPLSEKINGHIHFVVLFSNGKMMALSDVRKFSKIIYSDKKEVFESKELKSLGPDALDGGMNLSEFKNIIKGRKKARIKQILLNQEAISGIGNIYADEILWKASVSPERPANNIKKDEFKKIFFFMKSLLKTSIGMGGDSMSDYRNVSGGKGAYQNHHRVYKRKDKPCYRCGSKIRRIKIGGRSSHFCPQCQK